MNIKVDTHSHTLVSGHAYNTIQEMAKMAKEWRRLHLRSMHRRCRELAEYFILKI